MGKIKSIDFLSNSDNTYDVLITYTNDDQLTYGILRSMMNRALGYCGTRAKVGMTE